MKLCKARQGRTGTSMVLSTVENTSYDVDAFAAVFPEGASVPPSRLSGPAALVVEHVCDARSVATTAMAQQQPAQRFRAASAAPDGPGRTRRRLATHKAESRTAPSRVRPSPGTLRGVGWGSAARRRNSACRSITGRARWREWLCPLVVDGREPGHQINISAQRAPARQGSRFAPMGAPGASRPGIIRIERLFARIVSG